MSRVVVPIALPVGSVTLSFEVRLRRTRVAKEQTTPTRLREVNR